MKHKNYDDGFWARLKCGLHSGFPLCCILWQTFVHKPFKLWEKTWWLFGKLHKKQMTAMVGYVCCPFHLFMAKPKHIEAKRCLCYENWLILQNDEIKAMHGWNHDRKAAMELYLSIKHSKSIKIWKENKKCKS